MLNSERIVELYWRHNILCSWFLSHHSSSDSIYFVIEIPSSYRNFEVQKLLKATLDFGNYYDEHHAQKLRVGVSVSKLKMAQVKNTIKSFVPENKFHSYLTRETLPEEERVSKVHNHGNTPSYQNLADASVLSLNPTEVPLWIDEKALLPFETGIECHDHLLKKGAFRLRMRL